MVKVFRVGAYGFEDIGCMYVCMSYKGSKEGYYRAYEGSEEGSYRVYGL